MYQQNILISGASGNIGFEIIRGLKEIQTKHKIIAGSYNIGVYSGLNLLKIPENQKLIAAC